MRHEKHTWLLQHTLYKEIEEFLIDSELRSQDVALSPNDKQVPVYVIAEVSMNIARMGIFTI